MSPWISQCMQGYLNEKPSPEKQPFSTFKPWTVAVPDHHHLRIPPNQGAIPPEEGSECAREWHMQKWRFGKVVWLGLSAHWDLLGQTPFKRHYFWHNLGQIMRLSLSSSQFEQSRIKFNTGAFDSTVTKNMQQLLHNEWKIIIIILFSQFRLNSGEFFWRSRGSEAQRSLHARRSTRVVHPGKWTDQALTALDVSPKPVFTMLYSVSCKLSFKKNTGIGFWRWIVQRPKMQWLWPVGDESSALQWPCRC